MVNDIMAKNIRKIREERNLSFDKMSSITGVSKSILCQMEKGEGNPSINTLYKISNSLKISLSSLISTPQIETEVVDKNFVVPMGSNDNSFRIYTMFPFTDDRNFEVFYGEVDEGGNTKAEAHQAGTQEYLVVFKGELLIKIEEKEFLVKEGNAISFKADKPHSYHSVNDTKVLFCNTICYSK